ncbi:hypothetical protein [Mycobacterium avium]|uniref:hypothetical protein n=1 Tax=Mycobacterium avium TaxID=1764 RepID=UPI001155A409|nr:hypothetical protein [Mycobacterium avium]
MFDEYYRRTWEGHSDISPRQTGFATAVRVPLLASANPQWNYITGIVVCDGIVDHGVMPTDDEIAQVGAYLVEYRDRWLNKSFQNAMAHFAPYDIDGGANGGFYLKRPDGHWVYRKRTWTEGKRWWDYGDGSLRMCIAHNQGRAEFVDGQWLIAAS